MQTRKESRQNTRKARQPQIFCQPRIPGDHVTRRMTSPWKLLYESPKSNCTFNYFSWKYTVMAAEHEYLLVYVTSHCSWVDVIWQSHDGRILSVCLMLDSPVIPQALLFLKTETFHYVTRMSQDREKTVTSKLQDSPASQTNVIKKQLDCHHCR